MNKYIGVQTVHLFIREYYDDASELFNNNIINSSKYTL